MRRPANPADNRLTVRFSPEEIRRIVSDSRKRRVFPSETVRQIIRLYYAPNPAVTVPPLVADKVDGVVGQGESK